LYCWWVCPTDAIRLDGPVQGMSRQIERYKLAIEGL
jgi:hypothetical protein